VPQRTRVEQLVSLPKRTGATRSPVQMVLAPHVAQPLETVVAFANTKSTSLLTAANESDFGGYFIPAPNQIGTLISEKMSLRNAKHLVT